MDNEEIKEALQDFKEEYEEVKKDKAEFGDWCCQAVPKLFVMLEEAIKNGRDDL